jgi:hypothetical protein
MKKFLIVGLLLVYMQATAQWSNTTNQFYDSLHTPVSLVTGDEQNPLVLKSYPDSGYFVIWLDSRNAAATKTDIYAQKYDKNGNRLWAENGKPVTAAAGNQTYNFSSNQDYRSRSFAATDSAGGFYICYTDDNAYYPRIIVQHIKNNGSAVFSEPGYIAATTTAADGYFLQVPFLIPDGKKGIYLSYVKNNGYSLSYVYVTDLRDENGTMKSDGDFIVNNNVTQKSRQITCATQYYVDFTPAALTDYNIWPDGQGGCNIIMSMNNGSNVLAYNRIFRAKANAKLPRVSRNNDGIACTETISYTAGNIYMLYNRYIETLTLYCDGGGGSIVAYNNELARSNGYSVLAAGAYDYNYPKGITMPTPGNININLIAVTERDYVNNSVSNPTVQAYAYKTEKFDSIPLEAGSSLDDDIISVNGITTKISTLNIFNTFRDTLLATDVYTAYPDFSLASGGNVVYAAALLNNSANANGTRQVRLQCLTLDKGTSNGTDSFYFSYKAPKAGRVIGSELFTGGPGGIAYEFPRLNVTPAGKALFSIYDAGRSTRVSPVIDTRLTWGAMGRPVGTGINKNAYYGNDLPVAALDPQNGTGILAWRDSRGVSTAPNTGINIFMRHLDKLTADNYTPPVRPVRLVPNSFTGISEANPLILYGTSGATTPVEFSSIYFDPSTTTLATITDEYNIGRLQAFIYQNSDAIRRYNGNPYLDRNFTFLPQNTPANLDADMALYFTKTEFAALKAADPTIHSIEDLSVVNQPLVPNTVPAAYAPVADERYFTPYKADSIESGYLLRFSASRFGNFFIMKLPPLVICPGGSATLTAGVSAVTYKWAVNTDGGNFYTEINDDSHYSGTNTSTLQLTDIPSSWYEYKFVCVINGKNSSRTYTLQFANTWNGAVNGNWNNPANWSCNQVPDANTDVIISAGSVNVNVNGFCRTLTTKPGTSVTVKPGFTLTVTK